LTCLEMTTSDGANFEKNRKRQLIEIKLFSLFM